MERKEEQKEGRGGRKEVGASRGGHGLRILVEVWESIENARRMLGKSGLRSRRGDKQHA
jgi:hypothetical protein